MESCLIAAMATLHGEERGSGGPFRRDTNPEGGGWNVWVSLWPAFRRHVSWFTTLGVVAHPGRLPPSS